MCGWYRRIDCNHVPRDSGRQAIISYQIIQTYSCDFINIRFFVNLNLFRRCSVLMEMCFNRYREIMEELLEMTLLKNWCFINICLGVSFVLSSDFTFSGLLPLMMTNGGYTKSQAALAITIGAAAELASKILIAIFTLVVHIKAKYMFFGAMICMAFAKTGE